MRDHKKQSTGLEGFTPVKQVSSSSINKSQPVTSSDSHNNQTGEVPGFGRLGVRVARRISLTLSYQAATRLHSLSSGSSAGLSLLGILSGSVGDHQLVDEEVPDAKASTSVSNLHAVSRSLNRSVPLHGTDKSESGRPLVNGDGRLVVQRLLTTLQLQRRDVSSTPGLASSKRLPDHSTPNVVATATNPVPVPTLSPSIHASPASLFPFSSMTKVAQTIKSNTSGGIASSLSDSVGRIHHVPPGATAGMPASLSTPKLSSTKDMTRNMAMSSPHLIKLLQGSEDSQLPAARRDFVSLLPSPPVKRARKKKFVSDQTVGVSGVLHVAPKVAKEPKTKKRKLEVGLNGISINNSMAHHMPPCTQASSVSAPGNGQSQLAEPSVGGGSRSDGGGDGSYLLLSDLARSSPARQEATATDISALIRSSSVLNEILCNGQYTSSSASVLPSDVLTEELPDEDLLALLDDVDASGMTDFLDEGVSSTDSISRPTYSDLTVSALSHPETNGVVSSDKVDAEVIEEHSVAPADVTDAVQLDGLDANIPPELDLIPPGPAAFAAPVGSGDDVTTDFKQPFSSHTLIVSSSSSVSLIADASALPSTPAVSVRLDLVISGDISLS